MSELTSSDLSEQENNYTSGRFTLLLVLFFVSGATSLIYQIIWVKQFHLVVGTSQIAVTTVLAGFMGGLALGAWWIARRKSSFANPMLVYAILEIIIALYALLLPFLLDLQTHSYLAVSQLVVDSTFLNAFTQFLLFGCLLVPPSFCMGMTLPLLANAFTKHEEKLAQHTGKLYGINTVGAVLGTASAGFILLPSFGLAVATYICVAMNLTVGVVAFVVSRRITVQPVVEDKVVTAKTVATNIRWLAFAMGAAGLVAEVAWFRVLGLILGGSTYSFTIMLSAFLAGIGIGGWVGGAYLKKRGDGLSRFETLNLILISQVAIVIFMWLSTWAYTELPIWYVWLYHALEPGSIAFWYGQTGLAMFVVFVPTLMMGIAFPLLVHYVNKQRHDESIVGTLYSYNTLGGIIGASLAGLVLIRFLGIQNTLWVAVLIYGGLALYILYQLSRESESEQPLLRQPKIIAAAAFIVFALLIRPEWDQRIMTAAMYKYITDMDAEDLSRAAIRDFVLGEDKLLFYKDGLSTTVTVVEQENGNLYLANNGKIDASSNSDYPTQILVVHIPFVYRPDAEKVLNIGLASGISSGAAVVRGSVKQLDNVELEAATVEASTYFSKYNNKVYEDPKSKIIINDARHHLLVTEDEYYDIGVSEPSNPWISGNSNLFTQEFFELAKSKLKPNGVWSQWMHMYGMKPDDLLSVLKAFANVFESVLVFKVDGSDLILIGSKQDLDIDRNLMQKHFNERNLYIKYQREKAGQKNVEHMVGLYMFDEEVIKEVTKNIVANTDDNMLIEYRAPKYIHQDTQDVNGEKLDELSEIPWDEYDDLRGLLSLAHVYAEKDWSWARVEAIMDHLVETYPDNAAVKSKYDYYKRKMAE